MTAASKVVIFGVGQMADIIAFYLDASDAFEVVGFTLDANWMTADSFMDRPVVPFHEVASHFPPDRHGMMLAIGFSQVNGDRARKFAEAKALGYRLPSYVHPSSIVHPGAEIGEHAILFENNVVQPRTRIGVDARIWANNYITRGTRIGDHVYLSSSIVLAGDVRIGDRCFIGANATVTPKVQVGARTQIGSGVTLSNDAPEDSVWIAPPPRRLPIRSSRWEIGAARRRQTPERLAFGVRPADGDGE